MDGGAGGSELRIAAIRYPTLRLGRNPSNLQIPLAVPLLMIVCLGTGACD